MLRRSFWRPSRAVLAACVSLSLGLVLLSAFTRWPSQASPVSASIIFELKRLPFVLENNETVDRHTPATMAGGVAVFDFNGDGKPDIFFTNGASIVTLQKDDPKYSNHLFRNDGNGRFTDVTAKSGLAGTGFDMGVAVGDYDNDGHPDVFVAGVHRNTLYHNNGDGTFTDVTAKAGLGKFTDPQYGPLWGVSAAWVDVNNDGLLDLFVLNYTQWDYHHDPRCYRDAVSEYCNPTFFKGTPNQLFLNKGDGTFEDISEAWGIRSAVGKGMGVAIADYDLDGKPDIFVANDTYYNFLFHNLGNKFEEVGLQTGTALAEDGNFIGGMGLDFRDIDNDGYPDIFYVALATQTFPLLKNLNGTGFREITAESGLRKLTMSMAAFGAAIYDFDNDGWKDLFVTRGDAVSLPLPGLPVDQLNTVFRNTGQNIRWQELTDEAGFAAAGPARNRGCAVGDLDGDGKIDLVVTALLKPAQIWMNRSPSAGHWLDFKLQGVKSNRDGIGALVKVTSASGSQWNHMTTSFCYASSSHGPVHFGLGADAVANSVEIRWPSGIVQKLKNVKADQTLLVKEQAQ